MNIIRKHLQRVLPRRLDRILDDPRRYEREWSFCQLLSVVMDGLLSGCKTLRDVEVLTAASGCRVPDTTLRDLLVQLDGEPLEEELAKQVKEANRWHELDNKELPIRLTAIDGKTIGVTKYEVDEYSLDRSKKGAPNYMHHVLRAFHTSSSLKLLMGQERVPAGTNEKGIFPTFLDKLVQLYGRTKLLEVLSMDAGFTSIGNAQAVVDHNLNYIFALKDARVHTITRESMELLGQKNKADRVEVESVNGKKITRSLYRAQAPQVSGWSHATEVWRICKETLNSKGKLTIENHYYVTNMPRQRLSHGQVLRAVRLHWSIENNANWVMDVAWKEDSKPWCNQALGVLSLMRMIAYNAVTRFKLRRLRRAKTFYWSWEQTLGFIKTVLFSFREIPDSATL